MAIDETAIRRQARKLITKAEEYHLSKAGYSPLETLYNEDGSVYETYTDKEIAAHKKEFIAGLDKSLADAITEYTQTSFEIENRHNLGRRSTDQPKDEPIDG